uniref:Uncharacterized protein n=1 Tax=Glossina austeni TaxID=7395 RepID=A0A1A9VHQ5_GLOAU
MMSEILIPNILSTIFGHIAYLAEYANKHAVIIFKIERSKRGKHKRLTSSALSFKLSNLGKIKKCLTSNCRRHNRNAKINIVLYSGSGYENAAFSTCLYVAYMHKIALAFAAQNYLNFARSHNTHTFNWEKSIGNRGIKNLDLSVPLIYFEMLGLVSETFSYLVAYDSFLWIKKPNKKMYLQFCVST